MRRSRFHLDRFAAPVLSVAGDEQLGTGVGEPESHGLGGESSEHERVHGADARAGERDDHGLDEHRQVDHDPVPRHDSQRRQRVRGL